MAYSSGQLISAYTAANDGVPPANFTDLLAAGMVSDAAGLAFAVNSAHATTALAELSYQFFTGKSPTKAGLDYLVNSPANPNDLNDPYYAKFSLENRYINFAANLGVNGEGATAFSAKYGALSFADYIASIYGTIIGSSYAQAAGINAGAAIADIVSRQAALTAIARAAGMINANSTAAQIDIATKAAAAGYLMGESVKADVGAYAAAANNFEFALINGNAQYSVDVISTYAGLGGGTGSAIAPYFFPDASSGATPPPAGPAPLNFVLTAGLDTFTGLNLDDTFTVPSTATFGGGDTLDGGAGNDTLTVTAATALTSPVVTISNIETANFNIANSLTLNTSAWTGLTRFNLTDTSNGAVDLTAGAATAVSSTGSSRGAANMTVNGGSSVSLTSTGSTTGTTTIGNVTAPTGAVTISNTSAGAVSMGAINVTGGSTVAITQAATNAVNTTTTMGVVTVNGGALTTSVTVTSPGAVTASVSAAGIADSAVTVNDVNSASTTLAGTITSVSASGYTTLSINDNALTSLSVTRGSGNVLINNGNLTVPTNLTLAATLNGVTGGSLIDSAVYTTLNLTTSGVASTLANVSMDAVTGLTVAGSQVLTLTSTAGLSTLATVTVSGSAGLRATLSTSGTVTAVDTSATTGASSITLNPSQATFTGGAGSDTLVLTSSTVSKTIALGGGDDSLTLALGTTLPTATVTGGAGTDTLSMDATNAATASGSGAFAAQVSGFERLTLTGTTNQTVDLSVLGGFNYVTTHGGNGVTLQNMASGGTLVLDGAGTAYTISNAAFTAGPSDVINLVMTDGSGAGVAFAPAGVTASNVETIAITTTDTQATPSGTFNDSVALLGSTVKTVTVGGNAGLVLTAGSTALTTVDASGITLGGFTFTSGALAADAVIKGSAAGTNTIDFSAATAAVTYTGGSGNDAVVVTNAQANHVFLGSGDNSLLGNSNGSTTVTAGSGADTVVLGAGSNNVNLGAGANSFTATSGVNIYVGGAGVDTVTVGGGANSLTTGTGADVIRISLAGPDVNTFTTITDPHAGETIGFPAKGAEVFTSAKVTLGGGATFQNYADAVIAAQPDSSVNGHLGWFQFGGATYLVESESAVHASFTDGTDYIIKLTGLVDLSTATIAGHALQLN